MGVGRCEMIRVSMVLSEEQYGAFQTLLGLLKVERVEEGVGEGVKRDRSTVKYAPQVPWSEALKAIGEKNLTAIVYQYLCEVGPCTQREIKAAKPAIKASSIDSVCYQLKASGLVKVVPIGMTVLDGVVRTE
jgi:hypothetical protein